MKEIDSIHCSKTQKDISSVLSVKNNEDKKKTKDNLSPLNEIFLGSFGSLKHSEITVNKAQRTEKENRKNDCKRLPSPEIEEVF